MAKDSFKIVVGSCPAEWRAMLMSLKIYVGLRHSSRHRELPVIFNFRCLLPSLLFTTHFTTFKICLEIKSSD
jgi:hypothetical protein